ncbi:hypothetical protein [uncultured Corynebacterium sp.]|uniref:hypothetical protein n=1 Tax=uncultured Corynebacterium sp. TaxID=159447 RepID=UPI0025D00EC7|nr:hypothetical protein [uncultured Corynebacterium sp.]
MPEKKIFPYARTSATIDDPSGALQNSIQNGAFEKPCPHPAGSPGLVQALEHNGRLPVNSAFGGLGGGRIVLGAVAIGLILAGFFFGFFSITRGGPSIVVPIVLLFIGGVLGAVAAYSVRLRSRRLHQLGVAWRNGWVRFAPARVGGVWISSASQHNNSDDYTHEVRYNFRAIVEVLPNDGGEKFTFVSSEFSAPADADGKPYKLHRAENPLDVLEPEHFNGWTIARYLAHDPAGTATISTDLSAAQVKAGVEASTGQY